MTPGVAGVFPKGDAVEAPHDNVMISVVTWVLDGDVQKQRLVLPYEVFHPGMHLPT